MFTQRRANTNTRNQNTMSQPTPSKSDHAPSNILIIEDDRDTANLYQGYLEEDYTTKLATSGEQAIEKLSPATDLILLDLNLPRMHGKEVLEMIEEDEVQHTDPRIIILTTCEPTEEVLEYPIDKYEMKPVYRDELHHLIEDITLQNQFQHLSKTLFQKRSKRNALNQAGKTDTELYRNVLQAIEEIEDEIRELYEEIATKS